MLHFSQSLRDRLGDGLVEAEGARAAYAQSEAHHPGVVPGLVVQPRSVEDVARVVREAAQQGWTIVGHGAGTSLEGNAAALSVQTLIVDFARMNEILEVSADDMLAVVQPGVTREQLNARLRSTGLFFPVDPGADATLGGMIATRASGTTTVRYGSMRDNVLGLKVVTASGEVIRTGTRARKSASGYDLTHLFTGSEGTLGLIVEATVRLHGQPERIVAAVRDFPTVDAAVRAVIETIQSGIGIARMELLDPQAVLACNRHSGLGLAERPTLFMEFHGSATGVAEEMELVRAIGDAHGGGDLRSAAATEERTALWKARHHLLWAARAMVPGAQAWVTDVCVPISRLADAIGLSHNLIAEAGLFAPILGHVGDGNFHVIFVLHPDDGEAWRKAAEINEAIVDHALAVGGTCTGEHGIGLGKREAMLREHGDGAVAMMREIKQALDPHNLFNRGKMFL